MTDFPDLKIKALVSFPAAVLDGTGIDVVKANGTYQFNIDFADFAPPANSLADPTHQNVLVWNDTTGVYVLVPASVFVGGGVAPATAVPLVESGAGAVGTGTKYAREDHVHPTGPGSTPGSANPIMDSVAAPGVATAYSREDHVHPSDTSRAPTVHTHTASQITDFAEATDDRVAALLVAGANITLTYNDPSNTLTIASTGGGGGASVTISDTPPGSPSAGNLWWESDTGILFIYYNDGSSSQWVAISGGSGGLIATSDTAPSSPADGMLWWRSTDGVLLVYYDDGNTSQWVQASPSGATGAVRYDTAQGLTAAQQTQAQVNIGVSKKNYIINGAMMVSQENGATALTASTGYPVDHFFVAHAASGTPTYAQIASLTPGGSPNRIRVTATVADATVAANDYVQIYTKIEGLRVSDLRLGTASAKALTVRFGCKGPAGTYCVGVFNNGNTRTYISEYVIAAGEANTDVVKSVTVPGDVAGTWLTDNNVGVGVSWSLVNGSTFQQAAGSWGTVGSAMGTANQFNFMGTAGNVFELFDVALSEGTTVPTYVLPDYASELIACQRYWQINTCVIDTAGLFMSWSLPVRMRANPVITGGGAGFTIQSPSPNMVSISQTTRAFQTLSFNARL